MQRDAFNLRGNQKEGKERQMFQLCNGCLDLFALRLKWKYQQHLHHQDADLRFGKVMWSEQAAYSSCLDHMLCYLLYILNHHHCLLPLLVLLKSLIPWLTLSLSTGQSTNQTTQQLVISDFDPSVTGDQHPSQSQQSMLSVRKKII